MTDIQLKIAKQVDGLVRTPIIVTQFRQKIKEYCQRYKEYRKAIRGKEEERQINCQNIIDNPRLKDKESGPPGDGYVWGSDMYFFTDEKEKDHDIDVEGWFPPSKTTVPPHPWPWSTDNDELDSTFMLPAQYLLLACCHDYNLHGERAPIITKEMINNYEDVGFEDNGLTAFHSLGKSKSGPESVLRQAEAHLESDYKDVVYDLESKQLAPVSLDSAATSESADQPETTGESQTQTGIVSRQGQEPPKESAQAYNLYYGTGKTQQEVADIMTPKLKRPVSQGQVSRWIKQQKKWRESAGLPVAEQAAPAYNIDPSRLELGERTDGHRMGDPTILKRMNDED